MGIIAKDIYNEQGDMVRIEFNKENGDHIVDAIWDENDEQTSEKRIEFRKWAYHMLQNMGYDVPL
jgi:hypothetical protein